MDILQRKRINALKAGAAEQANCFQCIKESTHVVSA